MYTYGVFIVDPFGSFALTFLRTNYSELECAHFCSWTKKDSIRILIFH